MPYDIATELDDAVEHGGAETVRMQTFSFEVPGNRLGGLLGTPTHPGGGCEPGAFTWVATP